ncbi:MAG TPA: short-chain dehydrogenase/reductase [Stellaceae bacterium]|nr:short-chain dehydrogenase/reductase [Stellaceae bacterium]
MDLGLSGRRVLVTGGSLGIGFATARGFLAEGCAVTIAARDKARLAAAVEQLARDAPGRIKGQPIDLSQRGAPEALAEAHGDADILINNAGAIPTGDIIEIDEARWRAAWDLKVFGYVNLTRAMYGRMRGRPPKVILNVIGTGAERPQWRYICGNAANIALNGLTKSLGGRSLDDGIRVVGVNPGAVDTERWRSIHQERAKKLLGDASRWQEVLLPDRPLGRAATPEEIADVIVFLASDRAGWICGEVVNIDGGALYRESSF